MTAYDVYLRRMSDHPAPPFIALLRKDDESVDSFHRYPRYPRFYALACDGRPEELIYVESGHTDAMKYVDLMTPDTVIEMRRRKLVYGLAIPDLFMRRLREGGSWSLFYPAEVTKINPVTGKRLHLYDVWGTEFEEMYEDAERRGLATRKLSPSELDAFWQRIVDNQIDAGMPHIFYKEHAYAKNEQLEGERRETEKL